MVLVLNLRGRVQKIEQLLSGGMSPQMAIPVEQTTLRQPERQQPDGKAFSSMISPEQSLQLQNYPAQESSKALNNFMEWLKEDWLLKLGAMLLLIGFGWLTTYAFLNNWIGPMGRIALGTVAGVAFIVLGWWRIKKYIHQGGIFLVLGSTTILLTLFAARTIYDFFNPLSALVVMFLSTAFVAFVSIKYNNRALALASLVLAGIAPLLTNAPSPDYAALFAYLFVVTLGSVWIVALTGKRELVTASLIMIAFYSLPHWLYFTSADKGALLLFAYAFSALFFLVNAAGILRLRGKAIIPDLVTAAGNGLFILAWIMLAAPDAWKSLIIAAWMIVFAAGAFMIFKITKRRESFYVHAGVGIAMLAAATSAELGGATLTIAYAIEGGLIALISFAVLKDIKIAERMSLLLAGPVILSVGNITSGAWAAGAIHKDFFTLLTLSLTFLTLGALFLRHVKEGQDDEPRQLNTILLIAGSIYAYILLWLSLHAELQNDNTAVMIALVVYTIVGLIAYFYGLANDKRGLRLYGGALVGFVVGRLLLVDIWEMELAGRIVTFFLIGALLVSTAFLGRKKLAKKMPNNANTQKP